MTQENISLEKLLESVEFPDDDSEISSAKIKNWDNVFIQNF